ncbi:hypothetical protein ACO0LB_20180 [Undibacterium sp. SXout7W]|uniref:hypothetical protein n=1 Tax=Undibacterium sp. SXout7W TaxID=3413049 RepID=UPI003BF149E5
MKKKKQKIAFRSVAAILCLGTLLTTACSKTEAIKEQTATAFKPTASIQEIMQSIIDPNIDAVWNSVATISTTAGTEERSPKTDEEWSTVRQHALVVLEASNLLLIEGRKTAVDGANTSTHPVELRPEEIEKSIAANRQVFNQHAHALHEATLEAIAAIDAKSTDRLVKAGGRIDQTCEQCHTKFWYPGDKRPF